MLARLRAGLSYANVVGTLALFIALGGVSYAAVTLPAHSVGSKQLKTDAVTSDKVRNGTLLKRDFKDGALPRGKAGETGQDGQPGDAGPPGQRGDKGAPGLKGDTGAPGAGGAAGPSGPAGADGHTGAAGATGPTGPAGADGHDGLTGPTGPAGPQGPQGPSGSSGAQGTSGVVTTARITGFISSISPADNVWQFLGSQASVTTTSSQRLTAATMVPIATTGSSSTIKLDVCYQPSSGGAISPFSGGGFAFVAVTSTRVAQSAAGSVVPGAGTWKVGACTQTTVALDNNDFVNGYVQVTN
ncbi:MAG: hypothetical protein QOJ89_3388 [bacterium]|jgi:hypothetical protein